MQVTCRVGGEMRELHPIARDEVYRVACEAIRNACCHSGARRLEIALIYGSNLALSVRDDGEGIDAAVISRGRDGHFGSSGMRERAAVVGGTLTIGSALGEGTEIRLIVPGCIIYTERLRR